MPPHPRSPHLVGVRVNGMLLCVVRAMSVPEARDYFLEQRVRIERLTADQAFHAGSMDVPLLNAKPEYEAACAELFPDADGATTVTGDVSLERFDVGAPPSASAVQEV